MNDYIKNLEAVALKAEQYLESPITDNMTELALAIHKAHSNAEDMTMTYDTEQNIKGLEAAYQAVFNRTLKDRVMELAKAYPDNPDNVCTELNPNNPVPCHWKLSDLIAYYTD